VDAQNPNSTQSPVFRLFVALPVPVSVKSEIQLVQDQLRRELSEQCARWTRPEQWHLTLKFLGNVESARVDELTDALRGACATFAPFVARAKGIGCFPDLHSPRVVWVGVTDVETRLRDLARAVENAAAMFSSELSEDKFAGHITIARIKQLKRPQADILTKFARGYAGRAFGEWTADAVDIMRSELTAGGARHTCLTRLTLEKIT
jgi:2'-5' RNA ligase